MDRLDVEKGEKEGVDGLGGLYSSLLQSLIVLSFSRAAEAMIFSVG